MSEWCCKWCGFSSAIERRNEIELKRLRAIETAARAMFLSEACRSAYDGKLCGECFVCRLRAALEVHS